MNYCVKCLDPLCGFTSPKTKNRVVICPVCSGMEMDNVLQHESVGDLKTEHPEFALSERMFNKE